MSRYRDVDLRVEGEETAMSRAFDAALGESNLIG